jgi:hypothetical protein
MVVGRRRFSHEPLRIRIWLIFFFLCATQNDHPPKYIGKPQIDTCTQMCKDVHCKAPILAMWQSSRRMVSASQVPVPCLPYIC